MAKTKKSFLSRERFHSNLCCHTVFESQLGKSWKFITTNPDHQEELDLRKNNGPRTPTTSQPSCIKLIVVWVATSKLELEHDQGSAGNKYWYGPCDGRIRVIIVKS